MCYVVPQRRFESFYLKNGRLARLIQTSDECCSSCTSDSKLCGRETGPADCVCHFVQYFDVHTLGIPWNGALDLPQFRIGETDPVYCIDWCSTTIVVDSDITSISVMAKSVAPSAAPTAETFDDPFSTVKEGENPEEEAEKRPQWDAEEKFGIAPEDEGLFEELNAALPESSGIVDVSQEDEEPTIIGEQLNRSALEEEIAELKRSLALAENELDVLRLKQAE